MIKEEATWDQIIFCKALNLDLKWNVPEEAKAFVLEKIRDCEVIKKDKFRTLYKENGETFFILDSKYKFFYFDYHKIHEVLRDEYYLKDNEINELVNSILEENLKLKGIHQSKNKFFLRTKSNLKFTVTLSLLIPYISITSKV